MTNQNHNSTGHGSFEGRDITVSGVAYFLIGLFVALIMTYVIVEGVYHYLDKHFEAQQTPVSPLATNVPHDTRRIPPQYKDNEYEKYLKESFPAPQLEVNERTELTDERVREENTLNTYDYVDKSAGTVRIPIERAMDLIVERGLPVRQQPSAASTVSTATAKGMKK